MHRPTRRATNDWRGRGPTCRRRSHLILTISAAHLLAVLVCQSAWADDGTILFQEDFEAGSFAVWDAAINTSTAVLEITSENSWEGDNSARVAYEGDGDLRAYLKKALSPDLKEFFLRFHLYLDATLGIATEDEIFLVNALNTGGKKDEAGTAMVLKKTASDRYSVAWMVGDDRDQFAFIKSQNDLESDRWYCIELKYTADSTNGGIEFWLDGRYQGRALGRSNGTRLINTLYFGSLLVNVSSGAAGSFFFDGIVIGDRRIGSSVPFESKVGLSATTLTLEATTGHTATNETALEIFNRGGDVLSWTISHEIPWLRISPSSGVVKNANHRVTVTADPSGLPVGSYTGTIQVDNTQNPQNSETVEVSLRINEYGTILFSEDFESEDLPGWTLATPDPPLLRIGISPENAAHGETALKITYPPSGNGDEGYLHAALPSPVEDVRLGFYLYLDSDFSLADSKKAVHVVGFGHKSRNIPILAASMTIEEFADGELYIYWTYRYDVNKTRSLKAVKIQKKTWYRVELGYLSALNGRIECWINGIYCDGVQGRDTSGSAVNTVFVGSIAVAPSAAPVGSLFIDAFVIGDTRVGSLHAPFIPDIESSSELQFGSTLEGTPPAPKTLEVYNAGGGVLSWKGTSNTEWLSFSPSHGTVTSRATDVTVSVDTTGLEAGTHTGIITLENLDFTDDTQTIVVNLSVDPHGTTYFSENFESGDLAAWTGTNESPDASLLVSDEETFDSTQALKIGFAGGDKVSSFLHKRFDTSYNDVSFRFYFALSEDFALSEVDKLIHLINFGHANDHRFITAFNMFVERSINDRRRLYWSYYSKVDRQKLNLLVPVEIETGRWYCVDVRFVVDPVRGGLEYWIDGQHQAWYWSGDTSKFVINAMNLGSLSLDVGTTVAGSVYFDDLVVGDRHLGCGTPYLPELGLSHDSVALQVTAGKGNPHQTVEIYNRGGTRLNWTLSHDLDWLTVTPSSGTIVDRSVEITFKADATSLPPATYTGTAIVENTGDPDDKRTVNVSLKVNENGTLYLEDDFEAGDLDDWIVAETPFRKEEIGSAVSLSLSEKQVRQGTSSLEVRYLGAGTKQAFLSKRLNNLHQDLFLRFSIFFDDDFQILDPESIQILALRYETPDEVYLSALLTLDTAGNDTFQIHGEHFLPDKQLRLLTPFFLEKGRWYTVEIRYLVDRTAGGLHYWVDGVYQGGSSGQDTSAIKVNHFSLGSLGVNPFADVWGSIYFDSILVGDTHLGTTASPFVSHIGLTQADVNLAVREGGSDPTYTDLGVYNAGGGVLRFDASSDATWLSISPSSAEIETSARELTLSADVADLAAGTYTASLVITNRDWSQDVRTVPVSLEVTPVDRSFIPIAVDRDAVLFKTHQEGVNPIGVVNISNPGGGNRNWRATAANLDWLAFAPTNGTLGPGESEEVILLVEPSGLFVDIHSGTITFENEDNPDDSAAVDVTLLTGFTAGFEPTNFGDWAPAGEFSGVSLDVTRRNSWEGDVSLRASFVGTEAHSAYFTRKLDATYQEITVRLALYLDNLSTAGSTVEVLRLGHDDGTDQRKSAWLTISHADGRTAAVAWDYSLKGGETAYFDPKTIAQGKWHVFTFFYIADHMNGRVESWIDGHLHGTRSRLDTSRFPINSLSLGSVGVSQGGSPSGAFLLDGFEIRRTHDKLGLTRTSLSMQSTAGRDTVHEKRLSIYNTGEESISWSASSDTTWLKITPSSGRLWLNAENLTVVADTAGLAAGTYTGTITVVNDADPLDEEILTVELRVNRDGTLYFSEDFETGQLGEWVFVDAAPNASISVVTENVSSGKYAMKANSSSLESPNVSFLVKFLPEAYEELFVRFYLFVAPEYSLSEPEAAHRLLALQFPQESGGEVAAMVAIFRSADDYYFLSLAHVRDGEVYSLIPHDLKRGEWICLEIGYTSKTEKAGLEYWINGTFIDGSFIPGRSTTGVNAIAIGTLGMDSGLSVNGAFYVDELSVGDARIGCLSPYESKVGLTTRLLNFQATAGKTESEEREIRIFNAGGGTLRWSAVADVPWIAIDTPSGQVTGRTDRRRVAVDTQGLSPGRYEGTLQVTNTDDSTDVEAVGVNLDVNQHGTTFFREDFELGDFRQWSLGPQGNDASLAVDFGSRFEGSNTALLRYTGGPHNAAYHIKKFGGSFREIYVSLFFYLEENFSLSIPYQAIYFVSLGRRGESSLATDVSQVEPAITLALENVSDVDGTGRLRTDELWISWYFFYRNGQAGYSMPYLVKRGEWYFTEIRYISDPVDGTVEVWMNGEYQEGATDLDTSGFPVDTLVFGSVDADPEAGPVGEIYFDDIVVADTHIGVDMDYLPRLGVTEPVLAFEAVAGGEDPAQRAFKVFNVGGETLRWSASTEQTWLKLSATSGTVVGPSNEVVVSVRIEGLPVGTHTGSIRITNTDDPEDLQEVEVALNLRENGVFTLTDRFESDSLDHWEFAAFGKDVSIVTGTNASEGSGSLTVEYLGPDNVSYLFRTFTHPYDELTLRFYLQLDTDYNIVGEGSPNHLARLGIDDGFNFSLTPVVDVMVERSGPEEYSLLVGIYEGTELDFLPPYVLDKETWYCVELRYIADVEGGVDYWVNGLHKGGLRNRDTASSRVNSVAVGSMGVDDFKEISGKMYLDDLAIGDRRIGCDTPFISTIGTTEPFVRIEGTAGQRNPKTKKLGIYNLGGDILRWTAAADGNWFSIRPTSGAVSIETNSLYVSADITNLTAGTYVGTITIFNEDNSRDNATLDAVLFLNEFRTTYFSDDFESLDLKKWSTVDEQPGAVLSARHEDETGANGVLEVFHSEGDSQVSVLSKTLADSYDEVYAHFSIYRDSSYSISDFESANDVFGLNFEESFISGSPVTVSLETHDDGKDYLVVQYMVNEGQLNNFELFPIEVAQWYDITIHYLSDPLDGKVEYWVNGIYQSGIGSQDTSSFPVNTISVGSLGVYTGTDITGILLFDDIRITDRP